jgi:hypothetical protein
VKLLPSSFKTLKVDIERLDQQAQMLITPDAFQARHIAAGMSDKRIDTVITRLQAETKGLLGEMMLGSLIEAAKDAMTELNQPEGHCIFCLEQLVPEGINLIQPPLLRLPCYHCYHM